MPTLMIIMVIVFGIYLGMNGNPRKKAELIDKYGYDPRGRNSYDKLPESQKRIVQSKWDDQKIDKELWVQQASRRNFDNRVSHDSVYRGGVYIVRQKGWPLEYQLPSLDYYNEMARKLPSHLSSELIRNATKESREFAKKHLILHVQEKDYEGAVEEFRATVDKCNRYLATGNENVITEVNKPVSEMARLAETPIKPYTANIGDMFD